MDYADKKTMQKVGKYLIEVLKDKSEVPYSYFYNDQPGRHEALNNACMLDEDEEFTHCFIEWAAYQLQGQGFCTIQEIEGQTLVDGEPDFSIRLTVEGRERLTNGKHPRFRAAESRPWVCVKPASEWLICLLDAGHSDPLTLREVMEYGDSEGDVVIINHEGVEFRLGSDFFAWAFEVSLWHHARANHIEPVFESQEQKAAWDAFFDQAGAYTPTRTDLDVPHPHWDVPFHLVSGVKVGNVQLVGSIGG